jgi:hypothetical protein
MPAKCKAPSPKDSNANLGFEAKLWLAANNVRNNMDAAEREKLPEAARRVYAGAFINPTLRPASCAASSK